jgi:hypothetical protein
VAAVGIESVVQAVELTAEEPPDSATTLF